MLLYFEEIKTISNWGYNGKLRRAKKVLQSNEFYIIWFQILTEVLHQNNYSGYAPDQQYMEEITKNLSSLQIAHRIEANPLQILCIFHV